MGQVKYTHSNIALGLSPYFFDGELIAPESGTTRGDGWPEDTVQVDFDHSENTMCVTMNSGESYTIDVEGYGYDLGRKCDFLIDSRGIHWRDEEQNLF